MPKWSVMVATFPGRGWIRGEVHDYITRLALKLAKDPRIDHCIPWKESDTPIPMVRNKCVKDALKAGVDFLFMLDDDTEPDCILGKFPHTTPFWDTAFEFAINHKEPCIIAAPYVGPPPDECVFAFKLEQSESNVPEDYQNWKLEMFSRNEGAMLTGIHQCAALATGCILFDMRVFAKMPKPWFDYEYSDEEETEKATTEDVFATRNATIAGVPVFVTFSSWAAHHKNKRCLPPIPLTVEQISKQFQTAIRKNLSYEAKVAEINVDENKILDLQRGARIREALEKAKQNGNGQHKVLEVVNDPNLGI